MSLRREPKKTRPPSLSAHLAENSEGAKKLRCKHTAEKKRKATTVQVKKKGRKQKKRAANRNSLGGCSTRLPSDAMYDRLRRSTSRSTIK